MKGGRGIFSVASFQIKIVCFERLIGSLFWQCVTKYYVTYRTELSRHRPPYLYFDEKKASTFLFTNKRLTLEGFTTFMDCCLRTRASNVARNKVDYLGGVD